MEYATFSSNLHKNRCITLADKYSISAWMGISEVESATGLRKDTLRVWERRYGFPAPERDANGDRVYDKEQLQRLLLIRRLLDSGHRPSEVVALDLQALQARLAPPSAAPARADTALRLDDWLPLLTHNAPEGMRQRLRDHLLRHGLVTTIEQLIGPLSQFVGEAWQKGLISVFQEHLFSESVQSLLREALNTLGAHHNASAPPKVLLTTLPGELHTLGMLMAECFFAVEHCERIALGPNTPLPDLVTAAKHYSIDLLALSISAHTAPREVLPMIQRLRLELPTDIPIWIGGRYTLVHPRKIPEGVEIVNRHDLLQAKISAWRQTRPPTSERHP